MALIDKQAAINAIENTECELSSEAWDELTDAILSVQDVDAVEVVRCRDCKYYRRSSITNRKHCTYIFQIYLQTPNDFYCGWGERRLK